MKLSDLIRDNFAYFSSYRAGFFYYTIHHEFNIYQFTIPREDFENATLNATEKAITLTKWIKAALDKGELIKV